MVMLKISELVFPTEIYPRQQLDWDHVQRMMDAMEHGSEFPPIIICKRTRRVADGWHRSKAAERVSGGKGMIACIEKEYKNDEEFFLDSVRYNSEHGLSLVAKDRFRILEIGQGLKISKERIAGAMRMSVKAAGKLSVAPVTAPLAAYEPRSRVMPKFRDQAQEPKEDIVEAPESPFTPPPESVPKERAWPLVKERQPHTVARTGAAIKELAKQLTKAVRDSDDELSNAETLTALRELYETLSGLELTVQ